MMRIHSFQALARSLEVMLLRSDRLQHRRVSPGVHCRAAAAALCLSIGLAAQPLVLSSADRRPDANIEPATSDTTAALSRFTLPSGLWASLWAAEPMLANPLAMSFDENGRLFVTETSRYRTSGLDIRDYPELLERDLASRTIEDRSAVIEEAFGRQATQLTIESERVRLLEDTDGDGIADRSSIVASDFNSLLAGTASGILAGRGNVWVANVPGLYRLSLHAAGRVHASRPEEILRGFGVHIGFTGHDLHGLIVGPDGKLYFSIGDRGTHFRSKEGEVIDLPDTGAIFRCFPDGSGLEVVATGLRNPRGLAFDDFGNLFCGDTDSENGDLARLVQVVEGSDSGWRTGFQHALSGTGSPWIREGLWRPAFAGQPAYLLPPVCNIEPGPAGLAFHPGTGLTAEYRGRFFLCHFNGSPGNSGIRTYGLRPVGAGFSLVESRDFLRGAMPIDVTFGPDSRLYFADWVSGWPWPKPGRGRIYAVGPANGESAKGSEAVEARRLIAGEMTSRTAEALAESLGHRDQRVRLAAQFELAGRGEGGLAVLTTVAESVDAPQLARLHALWGMGQLADRLPGALNPLPALFADKDSEVRAQTARMLGDYLRIEAFRSLQTALQDPAPRVAFFAAQSLGKLRHSGAIPALIALLRRNDDHDVVLRHAIVVALARLGADPALAGTVNDPSRAVRLGGLLAYRRLEDAAVALFLEDFDPVVVRESARAINDVPIPGSMAALAALLDTAPLDDEALVLRVLNAHFRLGEPENAEALAAFAARAYVPASFRAEALHRLALWGKPPARDPVTGLRWALPPRDVAPARKAIGDFLAQLSGKTPEEVQVATIRAVAELGIAGTGHALWDVVYQPSRPVAARVAALQALEKRDDLRLEVAAQHAARSGQSELRLAALPILARRHPAVSLPLLGLLARGTATAELRLVYSILSGIDDSRADEILTAAVRRLATGEVPVAAQAELLDATMARANPQLTAAVRQIHDTWQAGSDRIAPFRSALEGGNIARGRNLFERDSRLACVKCHESDRRTGDGGPNLAKIADLRSKESLLESIVFPNAQIAPGFERVALTLRGQTKEQGVVQSDNESELELRRSDGTNLTIRKVEITRRESLASTMPEGFGQILSRTELRDLMAFLFELREPSTAGAAVRSAEERKSPRR